MRQNNEFLRKRPALRNRKVLYDLSNFLIPIVIASVGIIVSTQVFARMVGYNPKYTDQPFFVTERKFLFIDEGYPFFNPGLVFLNILSKGFTDKVIQSVILQSLFPLLLCAGLSVVAFFVISGIRGYGLDKNDRLYGTARWGTEKDVKAFGLSEEYGVVLAEFQKAKVKAKINPKDGSVQLRLIKDADLICLAGNTNVLMIAPTRSGKGVGSVIPTSLNFPWSVIFFDPKGELFNITSGFRSQFSTVLKFAPKNPDGVTVCFNPLEEVHLDKRIVSDVDLVIQNLFEEAKGGETSNAQFFNENAKDMIKTTILHILTADNPVYAEKKNLPGIFEIMSLAAKPSESEASQPAAQAEQQKAGPGDRLFNEMFETAHFLDGREAPWLQTLIEAGAGRMLQMNPKVRSDVFSTVFSKLQLFSDPLAVYPLSIVLAGYDDPAELSNLNTIYSGKTSYTILKGESCHLSVQGTKFIVATDSEGNSYTESGETPEIEWLVEDGLSFISFRRQENTAVVKGLSAGTARIKASLKETDDSVIFYVRIKEPGVIEEGKPCYLTTSQNSVTIKKGETADIFVTPVNIDGSVLSQIEWKNKTPELFSISANGDSATLTALQEGNGIIEISHPLSKNTLTLNVRVGNEFIYKNTDVAYISSQDIVRLRTDSEEFMLSCILAHTESSLTETQGFHFSSSDKELFVVSYSSNGSYCFITPKKAGQGILKIHHEKASYDKEVLVIIEKSVAELAEIPYLSTSQNVVTVIQGEYITLSASLNNGNSYDPSKWEWITQDGSISDLIVNSGSSAMISGVSPGTTKFSVMHEECLYPLEIIVICMDASSVRENPFIRTSTNIVTLGLGKSQTITAEMIGGENASGNFFWSISDSSVALVSGGGSSCYVRGLKSGQTYITVRSQDYPAAYSKTVFIRVEEATDESCYISVSKKVIKMIPSQSEGETVTATLENGGVLDAKDFVWWADDYNIVSLTSITDTAKIVPSGISGTTYVHVKHPKVLNTVDILVLCSEYSEFAFSADSKSLLEKSIFFIPMQVPLTAEKSWIEYESSDNEICVVTGSDKVCMIAGISKGSATVTAMLRTAGGIAATAQMAVIVGKAEEAVNTVSCGTTIINMEIGESKTLEALLSGAGISPVDSYDISWISSDSKTVSVLQNGEGKSLEIEINDVRGF